MFSRFQVLVPGLHVLNNSYTNVDHIKKILRSLTIKYKPKVISIQEDKDLNSLNLEGLISNLQSHEIDLNGDEPGKKIKTMDLKSIWGFKKYS